MSQDQKNKKLLEWARHYPCQCCGVDDGTIVASHYQGPMSNKVGKGMGRKPHNYAIAYLCSDCHDCVDGRNMELPTLTRLAMWSTACANTYKSLIEDGRLEICK